MVRNENGVLVLLGSIAYARASQIELRDRSTDTHLHSTLAYQLCDDIRLPSLATDFRGLLLRLLRALHYLAFP